MQKNKVVQNQFAKTRNHFLRVAEATQWRASDRA